MRFVSACLALLLGLLTNGQAAPADLPKLKFNEVREIAPGVFFRYSSISATDPKVPFGGSNHTWVVFEDYVVVIDANFPKEAGDVLAAIRKTTDKPVRYVFDTHHHGDHAYGNAVWAKAGATIVAQANCARLLRVNGPKEFAEAGRGPNGRKDVAASKLKVPSLIFDDKLVLDDGTQRVEFRYMAHGHTAGDAVAYLPKHKILCTGDACVNGAYNYMGHSDSASWVRALEKMQQLDVKLVVPGHGPLAGPDLLERQKRYFVELRQAVRKGLDDDKEVADIIKGFQPAWYKAWTGVMPAADSVRHVYDEMTGRVGPWGLAEDFGIYEGPSPTKDTPGWTKPKRIVVPSGLMPARLADLKRIAPEVEFLPVKSAEAALSVIGDADGVMGLATPALIKAGKKLRWAQAGPEGITPELLQALEGGKTVLTDTRRANGPQVADQAFALLLGLTRGVGTTGKTSRGELRGKTMLVVGLGGSGAQVARRAHAFGMRVLALDDEAKERPDFVFGLEKLAKLAERLPQADVVVLARPLTGSTRGMLGEARIKTLKKTAYVINSAHTGLIDLEALTGAVRARRIAGAGLDVSDAHLPANHPLRSLPGVLLTTQGGSSPEARERQWQVDRENVRRFVAGEPLLCVVDRARGE